MRLEDAAAVTRRRHGRVRCDETKCTLGEVLDLSASGVRVLIRGRVRLRVGAVMPMVIEIGEATAPVEAAVVWVRRAGWFRHIAGLQFVNVTPQQRARLVQIAQIGSNNEFIREKLDRRSA